MYRQCICGVPIPINRPLCLTCHETYPKPWPEWLRVYMANYERELKAEIKAFAKEVGIPESMEA